LQNRCVAAFSSRPRADSSSPALNAAAGFFFAIDLAMRGSKSERGKIIKSHLHARIDALKIIAGARHLLGD
jgi:hypothetical protein